MNNNLKKILQIILEMKDSSVFTKNERNALELAVKLEDSLFAVLADTDALRNSLAVILEIKDSPLLTLDERKALRYCAEVLEALREVSKKCA